MMIESGPDIEDWNVKSGELQKVLSCRVSTILGFYQIGVGVSTYDDITSSSVFVYCFMNNVKVFGKVFFSSFLASAWHVRIDHHRSSVLLGCEVNITATILSFPSGSGVS